MRNDLIIAKRYSTKAKNAAEKGREFTLSLKTFIRLMQRKHCQYTGLRFSDNSSHPLYRTLERVDASIGYTEENTVVVCSCINLLKSITDDTNNPLTLKHVTRMLRVVGGH